MASSFFDKFGLSPDAGSDASAFAESMDKAAIAAEKLRIEKEKGLSKLEKSITLNKKLLATAEKALERKKKQGKSAEVINKAQEKLEKLQKRSNKLTESKAKMDKEIAAELKSQGKFLSVINVITSALAALTMELLNRQTKIREQMGLTVDRADDLLAVTQAVSGDLAHQGISFEKSSAAAQAIYKATKNFANVTKENVANVALVSQKFGVSVDDTAKIAQTMKEIGGYTMEQSTNMIAFASAASEVVGVNPKDVMADIANSAETAAKYFGNNPKELAKAAIEARRLGLSLDDMAGVSDKLLDINTNIEAQFTAQVLTGRQFNFDQARRLVLSDDIEGATKAILGQMGSIDEFNKMDVHQKKAVAEAAGLTVTQLSTALTKQKAMNDMTSEEKAEYDKLLTSMDEGNKSDAQKLLDQTKSLALQEQFNATINQLKETLMNTILPLFTNLSEILSPILKTVGGIFSFIFKIKPLMASLVVLAGIFAAKSAIAATKTFALAVTKIFAGGGKFGPIGLISSIAAVAAMTAAMTSPPALAQGGVTTGPTMAMVGDNPSGKEAIIPLEKAGEMGFGGNKELIAKIDELISVVKTAKPINMDGAKIGEAVYLGSIQSGVA